MRNELRVAIVGCGAITEIGHLPAASVIDGLSVSVLIDKNLARAQELAEHFGIEQVREDLDDIAKLADAAIVAVPHPFHKEIGCALLNTGMHVLIEKPMAVTTHDCDELINAEAQSTGSITIGHMRRHQHSFRFIRSALQNKILGEVESFHAQEGREFRWPVKSDYLFKGNSAGGGVLLDSGVHVLDALAAWFGEVDLLEYRDDQEGGTESNCLIAMKFRSGIHGEVELSRTRNLANHIRIKGSEATLTCGLDNNQFALEPAHSGAEAKGQVMLPGDSGPPQVFPDLFKHQLASWRDAILDNGERIVSAQEGKRAVHLAEICYESRQPLDLPWESYQPNSAEQKALSGLERKTILVTGATGFIGGRLIEVLSGHGECDIRVLCRDAGRLTRSVRFPISYVIGDPAEDPEAVDRAVAGCHAIIHLAHDFKNGDNRQSKWVEQSLGNLVDSAKKT